MKNLTETQSQILDSIQKEFSRINQQSEPTRSSKQNTIEVSICYYKDETDKKVYDIEHMQNEFNQKLKELQS